MASTKNYWLMKSEPTSYHIDDLKRDGATAWDGVRNYQARNFMRDDMKRGDEVLFYHSNTKPPHVAGLARIVRESYPDPTQFDKKSRYYDDMATKQKPRWFLVDIAFVKRFNEIVPLYDIKADQKLSNMMVAQRGSRLSINPVSKNHFDKIVQWGNG